MKNMIKLLIICLIGFWFTGCSPKMLDGQDPATGKNYNGIINKDNGLIRIAVDMDLNEKERISLIIRKAALEFKKQKTTAFTINTRVFDKGKSFATGMSPLTTNFKDLFDYCYPSSLGLETKCKYLDLEKATFIFTADSNNYFNPTWSVEQVLNDNTFKTDKELILKEVSLKDSLNLGN